LLVIGGGDLLYVGDVFDWEAPLEGGHGQDLLILQTGDGPLICCSWFDKFLLDFLVDLPESDVVAIGCDQLPIFPLSIEPIDIDQTFLDLRAPQCVKLMLMSLKLRAILKISPSLLISLGAIEDDDPASPIPHSDRLAFFVEF
jgi:hypothetical protein